MTTDILVVGIGGQGVMTAAEAIALAAIEAGLEATKTEVTGMSQRGGVVCSQIRVGERVEASEVRAGSARLLIAFEAAEGLRWSHYLAPEGEVLLDSWRAVPPIDSSGVHKYPDDPAAALRAAGRRVIGIGARAAAEKLGDARRATPQVTRELAELVISRVAEELGVAEKDYDFNVFPNLGYFVLAASPVFVERVVDQPEVAWASANRRKVLAEAPASAP